MKKYLFLGILVLVLAVSAAIAIAARPNFVETEVGSSNGHATVVIPERAVEVMPGVFYLGMAVHHGELVEGYALFGKAKPVCGNGICEPGETAAKCPADCAAGPTPGPGSSCYAFLASGAKWKTIEPWMVNPANTRGLISDFVFTNLATNIGKWETAASFDILGAGSLTSEILVADMTSPDDKNEVYFADIADPGAIGITVVWGIFSGPPKNRKLVEWDQVYDDYDYDWSSIGETGKMDFENIATHELGHSVGMSDLYNTDCSAQTMYGYADYGETNKRTLEAGDIAGINALY